MSAYERKEARKGSSLNYVIIMLSDVRDHKIHLVFGESDLRSSSSVRQGGADLFKKVK